MLSLKKQEDNIIKINLSINPKIKNIEDIIKEVNNFIKDEKKNKNYI
jgi:predicted phage-related endonuclease